MQHTHTLDLGEECAIHVYTATAPLLEAAEKAAAEASKQCEVRPVIKMFGKEVPSPRDYVLLAPAGEGGDGYKFSGAGAKQAPMGDAAAEFYEAFSEAAREQDAGFKANRMLVNMYNYVDSSIGWHADDEKGLVINESGVWGITVYTGAAGEDRRMWFRSNTSKLRSEISLKHGQVFVMHGKNFQRKFKHSIPKVGKHKVPRPRVSFTFRQHVKK